MVKPQFSLFGLILFSHTFTLGQVRFSPDSPNPNQDIEIYYVRNSSIFEANVQIFCKIYFTGNNEDETTIDFPKVFEAKLLKKGDSLYAKFMPPANSTGAIAIFLDSLRIMVDNNGGDGYWTPLFRESKLLPGSLSGIADLHAGGWPPQFHLEQNLGLARRLYEDDFKLHPYIKRKFTNIIRTFQLKY